MFDPGTLAEALAAHGRVARVVVAARDGSSPREVGAAMLVWPDGQSGTIGGGALEWEALGRAREMLLGTGSPSSPSASPRGRGEAMGLSGSRTFAGGWPPSPPVGEGRGGGVTRWVERIALGPSLGQCCGGAVTLLTEVFTALPPVESGVVARSTDGREMPLEVKRLVARARSEGILPVAQLLQGWFVEPVARAQLQVWIWGAGHVGRALAAVLAPLPGVAITWVDVAAERFPEVVPEGVTVVPAGEPGLLVARAPQDAAHFVLTFSHALDLELCHRLLGHGFARCGLIGSATKWARFRSRLAALGHSAAGIAKIDCPIGDPGLGKHPQAIAIGVAAEVLAGRVVAAMQEGRKG